MHCQKPERTGGGRSRQAGRNDVDSQAHEEIHFMERQRGHAMEQLEVISVRVGTHM